MPVAEEKSKRKRFSIDFFLEVENFLKPYQIISKKGFERGHIIRNLFPFSKHRIEKLREFTLPLEVGAIINSIEEKINSCGEKLATRPEVVKDIHLSLTEIMEKGVDSFLTSAFHIMMKDIRELKGIGEAGAKNLKEKGIGTLRDLLFFLPKKYQDRKRFIPFNQLREGVACAMRGRLIDFGFVEYRSRKTFEAIFSDGTGFLNAKWFHYKNIPFHRILKRGKEYFLYGTPSKFGDRFEVIHPELREDEREFGIILPIYPEIKGIPRLKLRKIIEEALCEYENFIISCIPPSVERRLELPALSESIKRLHFPEDENVEELNSGTTPYHKRLLLEEIFSLELAVLMRKKVIKERKGVSLSMKGILPGKMKENLPFQLTSAQKRVLKEMEEDLRKQKLIYRLIQGDVGSGKTVVVAILSLYFIEDGYQVAMMVPTEILATQHYHTIKTYYEPLGIITGIIKGSMKESEKRKTAELVKNGEISFVVGTHALLEEYVEFKNLGLVIVDEQHRFGVLQRVLMKKKGNSPHVIVMSATPIPRTLAMTIYGDLDVSVIDEMPRKRNVTALLYHYSEIEKVYEEMRKEVKEGGRVFVVYPLIEESESLDLKNAREMFNLFKERIFPDLKIGLLHGKMKPAEKDSVMESFRNGEIDILVSTTVIEVGIDVPEATMIVIENAERFGLSQLHQLRGRIGRGEKRGKCILLTREKIGEKAWRRLKVITETDDGFRIAEEDLKIRGPGEILGTKQWGFKSSEFIKYLKDIKLLKLARELAIYTSSAQLPEWEKRIARRIVEETRGELLEISLSG